MATLLCYLVLGLSFILTALYSVRWSFKKFNQLTFVLITDMIGLMPAILFVFSDTFLVCFILAPFSL